MNDVLTMAMPKDTWLQIRIREEIKDDLRIAAELRGLTVSALLHSLIVKTIREEKEVQPSAFPKTERQVNGNRGRRTPELKESADRVRRVANMGKISDVESEPRKKRRAG